MFQSFPYLRTRLSNFIVIFYKSQFLFVAIGVLDVSQFVKLL